MAFRGIVRAGVGWRLAAVLVFGLALLGAPGQRPAAVAQSGPTCTNPPPFIDPTTPANLYKSLFGLAALVSPLVTTNVTPGISVGVVYNQKLVWAMGAGCANREMGYPAAPDTVYRIESVTKLFEATGMMQQRDAGRFQVSDAVASSVPQVFYSYQVPNLGTTTTWYPSFLELASHTGGLPDPVPAISGTPSAQIAAFWSYLNARTVTNPRAYQYSDLGNVAMGQAVALIAGYTNSGSNQAYHQYVTEKILQPLGMSASTFNYQSVPAPKLAFPYQRSGQTWTPDMNGLVFGFPLAGDVFTSVNDMAKFVSLQFRTGPADGSQILKCSSLQEMWEPVAPTVNGGFVGTGWFILPPPQGVDYSLISKDGGSPTFAALVRAIPELRLGVVAFTNYGTNVATPLSTLQDTIFRTLVPALQPSAPVCTA